MNDSHAEVIDLEDLAIRPLRVASSVLPSVLSLLAETLGQRPRRAPDPWTRAVRSALSPRDVDVLLPVFEAAAVVLPGCIAPIPSSGGAPLRETVERIAAVDPDALLAEAASEYGGALPPAWHQVEARPERWLQAYARAIGSAGLAIEPVWRAARSLLERETERVGTAAVLGASRELLGMLHAHGRLAGDRLVLERGGTEPARWVLPGEGLVLVPMLAGRGALVSRHRGDEVTHLAYPVPGIDRLLDAPRSSRDALEGLLGPPRATILRMLDGRMIAGDLARRLAVVPSAVTHHLAALEGAGLILRERTGRHVMVSRTARGSALLALYELPR